jgi:hypothetical protein
MSRRCVANDVYRYPRDCFSASLPNPRTDETAPTARQDVTLNHGEVAYPVLSDQTVALASCANPDPHNVDHWIQGYPQSSPKTFGPINPWQKQSIRLFATERCRLALLHNALGIRWRCLKIFIDLRLC